MHIPVVSAAKKKEIGEVLSAFGLNTREQATYVALLPMGTTSLRPLAQAAGLQLTTAQSVVARLAERGLVNVTKRGNRSAYEAHDPEMLVRLLERQAEELQGIVPLLRTLKNADVAPAAIRVFWRERRTDIFHEALASKEKVLHEIVAGRDIQEILGEKFHLTRRRVQAGIKLRSLRVESQEIKKYSRATHARELREAKFLPSELSFRCSILFWDDNVAFFTAEREKLAWVVRSASVSDTMRQLFGLLWEVSRRMETAA